MRDLRKRLKWQANDRTQRQNIEREREREIQCYKSTASPSLTHTTFKHRHTQNTHTPESLIWNDPFAPPFLPRSSSVLTQPLSLSLSHARALSLSLTTMDAGEAHSGSELWRRGPGEAESEHEDPNRTGGYRPDSGADGAAASGTTVGARYKLMSPAKLPISRSPVLTIPPGLSPTAFLESPVLLSNMKVSDSVSYFTFWVFRVLFSVGGAKCSVKGSVLICLGFLRKSIK